MPEIKPVPTGITGISKVGDIFIINSWAYGENYYSTLLEAIQWGLESWTYYAASFKRECANRRNADARVGEFTAALQNIQRGA